MKKSMITLCALLLIGAATSFGGTLTDEYLKTATTSQITTILISNAGDWAEWDFLKTFASEDAIIQSKVRMAIQNALARLNRTTATAAAAHLNGSNFNVSKSSSGKYTVNYSTNTASSKTHALTPVQKIDWPGGINETPTVSTNPDANK